MENLPRDVHLDIFSRLPIISFLQIKCVCKAWHAMAQDPRLFSMFSARANKRNPSLILHCDSPIVNKLCYLSFEEGPNHDYSRKVLKVVPPFISNMPEYQVVGSCNGLICISDALYFNPVYVCNFFTGDYIELPKTSHRAEQEVTLGFGNHPASKEYKMVRVVYSCNDERTFRLRAWSKHSDVQIFTIGTDAWRRLGSIHWRLDVRPSVVSLNGALHWVTMPRWYRARRVDPNVRIVAFDLAKENFKEIERPMCGSLKGFDFQVVNLRDCLSAVVCKGKKIEIWVMQVYDVKESWTKDYVISAYVPASFNRGARPESRIWRNRTLSKGDTEVEVICMMKNGDILLNYDEGALVLYSPHNGSFKELVFSGLPRWFSVITHVETLFSVEEVLKM